MPTDTNGFYLGIKFQGSEKSYYFSCPDENFALGDLVIVMTAAGVEAGTVSVLPRPLSAYDSTLELKAILRKGDQRDIHDYERNLQDAKEALAITEREVARLGLAMDLITAFYTIDGSKITITYTSTQNRVDFRELLKVLAPQLGCRIELRQIASRDEAKLVGGLGICGLPLCCSTFLTQFEGVGIKHAKNQMLTLNIPKLSGPCGKLICCLMYEDDAYTEAKKEFPRIGTVVKFDEGPYTVDSYNILSRTVRLVNATHSDYKTYSLEDVKAMLAGTYVRKVEITKAEEAPSPFSGLDFKLNENENRGNSRPNNQNNGQNRKDNGRNNRHDGRRPQQQQQNGRKSQNGGPDQQNGNQQNNNQQNPNRNNRHRHRHHHHGGGNRGGEGGQ